MSLPDLEPLAEVAREVAAEWGVELGDRFARSRWSFVAPAGADAVLKVSPSDDDESDHEADALELWGGRGAVRLLRCDRSRNALQIATTERRLAAFAEAGLDEDRIRAWALIRGACLGADDHEARFLRALVGR